MISFWAFLYFENNMNNLPQFAIFGVERRILKKELAGLKSYIKNFWYYHTLDCDMAKIFKSSVMSNDEAKLRVAEAEAKILELESKLSVPYDINQHGVSLS